LVEWLVLVDYPNVENDAVEFIDYFGAPKVFVYVDFADAMRLEEMQGEGEAEDEDEALQKLADARTGHEAVLKLFEEKCPSTVVKADWAQIRTPQELHESVCRHLFPRVYVIVAPTGTVPFSSIIADAVCASKREGKRPTKFTVIDCNALCQRGGHNVDIEEELWKASFRVQPCGCLPLTLWERLFKEAFSKAANPTGTFLVINFPQPSSFKSSPTVRDQFHLLESISVFMGILHVTLSEDAYEKFCSDNMEDADAYAEFDEHVHDTALVQFDANQICHSRIESAGSAEEAAKKAATEFVAFQGKAEQALQ